MKATFPLELDTVASTPASACMYQRPEVSPYILQIPVWRWVSAVFVHHRQMDTPRFQMYKFAVMRIVMEGNEVVQCTCVHRRV